MATILVLHWRRYQQSADMVAEHGADAARLTQHAPMICSHGMISTGTAKKCIFFKQSRLSVRQWIAFMYWWAHEYPVTDAALEAEKTAIQAYQYCWDICSWRLLNRDAKLM